MRLFEIEIGGGVDRDFLNHIENVGDFTNPQHDLFPEIPTLDPHLPKNDKSKMKIVGKIGQYRMVKADTIITPEQQAENDNIRSYNGDEYKESDYVLFDKNKPIGWIGLLVPPKRNQQIDHGVSGKAGQIGSIYIDEEYRGKNLGLVLYKWILTNVCDYLVADELQTMGGVKLWRRALNSRAFDVMVYDKRSLMSRKRWAGKDFNAVYDSAHSYELIPWITLRGKADSLMDDEYESSYEA